MSIFKKYVVTAVEINEIFHLSVAAVVSQDPGNADTIPSDPAPAPAGFVARRKWSHLTQLPFP